MREVELWKLFSLHPSRLNRPNKLLLKRRLKARTIKGFGIFARPLCGVPSDTGFTSVGLWLVPGRDRGFGVWLLDALSATKGVAIKQISAAWVHLLPGFPMKNFECNISYSVTEGDAVGIHYAQDTDR